jgi:hypothetical protein
MGFGQKAYQAPSTNFNSVRHVKGACGTSGNLSCTKSILAPIGDTSSNQVTINITNVQNITYNSSSGLTLNVSFEITSISGTILNGCLLSFCDSNNYPTASSNFISNTISSTLTTNTPYNYNITVPINQIYTIPSGPTTWNINTDSYWQIGTSYSSNNYEINFTA